MRFEQSMLPLLKHSETPPSFIVAIILISIAGVVVLVKLCWAYVVFKKLRPDDYAIIVAMAVADLMGEQLRNFSRVSPSFKTKAAPLTQDQYYYVSNILLYTSLAFAKTSAILCSNSIFGPSSWGSMAFRMTLGSVALWAITSEGIVILQCHPNYYALGPIADDTCIDQYAAQNYIKIVDIVTDIAIAIPPVILVSRLQMSGLKRLRVGFVFAARVVTVAFTAVSLNSLSGFYDADVTIRPAQAVNPSIWTSIALGLPIMTACLPHIQKPLADGAAGVIHPSPGEVDKLQSSSDRVAKQQTGHNPFALKSELLVPGSTVEVARGISLKVQRNHDGERTYNHPDENESGSERSLTRISILRTREYDVEYDSDDPENGQKFA
ncbi:hypothetical protein LTR49_025122 [Elasticomyces elasticus]|nr:hypothetical protein LTR49_025122 [Elasticomyces elasticus]